ncbi:MAG: hypothetical protein IT247_03635 [Bacteroidia bacterium]|nr:hypothetical protein [Bacteroidia bacterium]
MNKILFCLALMAVRFNSYAQEVKDLRVVIYSVEYSIRYRSPLPLNRVKKEANLKLKYAESPFKITFDSMLAQMNNALCDTSIRISGDYRTLIVFKKRGFMGKKEKYWIDRYGKFIDKKKRTFLDKELYKKIEQLIPSAQLQFFL